MPIALYLGVVCCLSATCICWHQIITGPQAINYPTMPYFGRLAMFFWGVTVAYRGFDLIEGCIEGKPEQLTISVLPPGTMLLIGQICILYFTLRQRMPARTWKRVAQIMDLSRCGGETARLFGRRREIDAAAVTDGAAQKGTLNDAYAAMAELSMAGFVVAGPDESITRFAEKIS